MKILFASYWHYPHIGGISTHIQMLRKGLEQLGHQVLILSGTLVNQLAFSFPDEAMEEQRRIVLDESLSPFIKEYELRCLQFKYIAKQINFDSFDVIHSHDVVVASILGELTDKKKILTVHGYLANEAISEKVINRHSKEEEYLLRFEELALKVSDNVIAVDSKIKNYMEENFAYQQDIVVMKNFIDLWQFYQPSSKDDLRRSLSLSGDDYIIVSPRRLVEKNGVIYAVKAMKIVEQHIPSAKLLCFGSGPQQNAIQEYINQNNLQNKCILAGSVEHEAVKAYIQAADTVIIPSVPSEGVEEATSLAAIEGMAMGKVVIASSIGGLKELITPEENGLLVPPFDLEQIAQAMIRAYTDHDLKERINANSKRYILTHHSHIQAAKEIEDIYL